MGLPGKEGEKETQEILEAIMAKNFLNVRHRTTDPGSSEDIKQDKQQNKKQNQKLHLDISYSNCKKIKDQEKTLK